jgi:RNA polymerase sigma factor (sigma-70 family)
MVQLLSRSIILVRKAKSPALEVGSIYEMAASQNPAFSNDDSMKYVRQIVAGNKAAENKLVIGNMRYLIRLAGQYAAYGVDRDALVSEGSLGLIDAAKKFDESFNVNFLTYATYYIRRHMQLCCTKETNMIKVPYNKMKERQKYPAVTDQLDTMCVLDGTRAPFEIIDERVDIAEEITTKMVAAEVQKRIDALLGHNKRAVEILQLRRDNKTLKEISDMYNISRERVRQIEAQSLKLLRSDRVIRHLSREMC